ncbi:MAG: hypothetical protein AAGF11_01940 [Myxococcota bacterium]
MNYRVLSLAPCLLLLTAGCILNDQKDVGSLPTNDGDEGGATSGSGGSTDSDGQSDADQSSASTIDDGGSEDSTEGGSTDTGEPQFPGCIEPQGELAVYALPFVFGGSRTSEEYYECAVDSIELPVIVLDCAVGEFGGPIELTVEGVDTLPFEVDESVLLHELRETGLPHGYIGVGQYFSLRRGSLGGELLMLGIDSALLNGTSEQFMEMPWEPEFTLRTVEGLCSVDSSLDCSREERIAMEIEREDDDAMLVFDGNMDQAFGFSIHVSEAKAYRDPCIDGEHGRFEVLMIRQ